MASDATIKFLKLQWKLKKITEKDLDEIESGGKKMDKLTKAQKNAIKAEPQTGDLRGN
ncbi:MAG TPA: hypothetical protein PK445_07190 [Methanolinea sp.]|nr:hypothetical protein [Methanolinea sp.]